MKSRKKQSANDMTLFIGLLIAVFILIAASFYLNSQKPLAVQEFVVNYEVKQGSTIGVNADTDKLDFGSLLPGGTSVKKFILLENSHGFDVAAHTTISPELVGILDVNETYLIPSMGNLTVPLYLAVSEEYPEGIYEGVVRFEIVKVR